LVRFLTILILSAAATALPPMEGACAEETRVRMVLSDSAAPYHAFVNMLKQSLPASVRVTGQTLAGDVNGAVEPADITIAVGMKATESALAEATMPVLGVMVHKTSYEALLEKLAAQRRPRLISAVYLNQPWERQLNFIEAVLPGRRKIGLLHSPDTHQELAGLKENSAARGLSLTARPVRSAEFLFSTLDELLDRTEMLLSIPDSTIYNASNVRNILLTSYRRKVPLIGISQAYVNAGALCAIFSTPEQLAEQTSAVLVYFAKNKRLPEPQYPATYSFALNNQVARSLGIELPSPETIRERMNKAGEGR
jgi:hypothetical protein